VRLSRPAALSLRTVALVPKTDIRENARFCRLRDAFSIRSGTASGVCGQPMR